MSRYKAVFDDSQASVLGSLAGSIGSYETRLISIANGIDARDGSMASLQRQMRTAAATLPPITARLRSEGTAWASAVAVYRRAETAACSVAGGLLSAAAIGAAAGAAAAASAPSSTNSEAPYSLRATEVEGKTYYERIYPDGYTERISEQGYLAEIARNKNGYPYDDAWGKTPGTISKLDYAIIADIPNKSHADALAYIRENFPDTHPFRQGDFTHKQINGLDFCIFEIDKDHAIITFGGTNDAYDIADDIRIGLGLDPKQAAIANKLIEGLPYENIMVTGHSLGGYIASDVAINNSKVKECVVFDAPGRGGITGLGALGSVNELNPKIINYYAKGDNVHNVGIQPGRSYAVDVGSNAKVYGPLGEHDLIDLVYAFMK